MPSYQPIELLWQHGKHYVSMSYKGKKTIQEVHRQIRLGWYGDPAWDGQEEGVESSGLQQVGGPCHQGN